MWKGGGTYLYAVLCAVEHVTIAWIVDHNRNTCRVFRRCERECAAPTGDWTRSSSDIVDIDVV